MSETESDDKQFDATEQKLRKAREKGDFPRSPEVNAALAYIGAIGAGAAAVGWAVPDWLGAATRSWNEMGSLPAETIGAGGGTGALDAALPVWGTAALMTLALVALLGAVVLLGLIAQRGIVFVPSKLAFDFNRINPVKNAGQKFGKSGLMTFAISTAKAVAVAYGGWLMFKALLPRLVASREDTAWVGGLEVVVSRGLILALVVSIVFAAVDLGWKHFDFRRRNRMSLKELKDEMKDSEGDPHMKAARRQRSMEIALSSMLADVHRPSDALASITAPNAPINSHSICRKRCCCSANRLVTRACTCSMCSSTKLFTPSQFSSGRSISASRLLISSRVMSSVRQLRMNVSRSRCSLL